MIPTLLEFFRLQGLKKEDFPDDDPLFETVSELAIAMSDTPPLNIMPTIILNHARVNLAMHLFLVHVPKYKLVDYPDLLNYKNNIEQLGPLGINNTGSDAGTSFGVETLFWAKRLTMRDLNYLRTPYGRVWLEFLQACGSTWGLTKNV